MMAYFGNLCLSSVHLIDKPPNREIQALGEYTNDHLNKLTPSGNRQKKEKRQVSKEQPSEWQPENRPKEPNTSLMSLLNTLRLCLISDSTQII